MLCVGIVKQTGLITDQEWDFFLRGSPGVEKAPPHKPNASWLTDEVTGPTDFCQGRRSKSDFVCSIGKKFVTSSITFLASKA